MQHTDKYNFNLIETSDPFSPDALNENAEALEAQLAALDAAKAEQTDLSALSARVGALETGRLRYKFGEYTGDGTAGRDVYTRLEFDFKPVLLIIFHPHGEGYGGIPWMRGMRSGRTYFSPSTTRLATLIWEDRAVQWFYGATGAPAEDQLNALGTVYPYLALGVAE